MKEEDVLEGAILLQSLYQLTQLVDDIERTSNRENKEITIQCVQDRSDSGWSGFGAEVYIPINIGLEMPHPAARGCWNVEAIISTQRQIQEALTNG